MAIKTKAVGFRFPLELIERIERYQNDRGVNFTEALVHLVERGLGGGENETITASDDKLDERITASINQLLDSELDKRITSIINDRLDVMLDERMTQAVKQPLDVKLDKPTTDNIPSDDSSNSDPVVEPVQVIQADAIEQVIGGISKPLSWGDFHKLLDLTTTGKQSKAKGDIAIDIAKEKGLDNWTYNSTTRKFTKQ